MKLSNLIIAAVLIALPAQSSDTQQVNLQGGLPVKNKSLTKVDSSRVMVLEGVVQNSNMDALSAQLKELAKSPKKPAYLDINSPGGSVRAGLRFIETMIGAKAETGLKVTCVITEAAYSMAAVIAAYCHDTWMLPGADMMFHGASYGVKGEAEDIANMVAFMNRWLVAMERELAHQLGLSYGEFRHARGRELWLTAFDASRLGFVNGITRYFYHDAEAPELTFSLFDLLFQNDVEYITEVE